MSDNHPCGPRPVARRADSEDGDRWPLPVPMRQVRIKLAGFATLSLVALALRLPLWSQLALLAATAAIPAAVALHGGRRLLGALLLFGPAARAAVHARAWRARAVRSHGA